MEEAERWPPAEFYRWFLVVVFGLVFSAMSFVTAVFLFTICYDTTNVYGRTVCVIPHQLAGAGFAILGVLLLALALFAGTQAIARLGLGRPAAPRTVAKDAPRRPDSPVPTDWVDRVKRGMGPRSWIDDYPEPDDVTPVRLRPPPVAMGDRGDIDRRGR